MLLSPGTTSKKVQVGKDQEKSQSEKKSHSKNRVGKKTKLTNRAQNYNPFLNVRNTLVKVAISASKKMQLKHIEIKLNNFIM